MSHAMSDDQVTVELRKMTAFIRQEALEKAKEIQLKADEEFAIEKSKLVRQEIISIDSLYAKKFKQASMSQQITRSTLANKTRLKVLSARQALLDELFEQARGKLVEFSGRDSKNYGELCKNLILQGLYALTEEKVEVRARKKDYQVVNNAIQEASSEYTEKTGKEVEIGLDEKNPLSEDSSGGITVVGGHGKIDVNNTLDERMTLLESDALPMVRASLFGKNENRKFYD